MMLNLFKVSNEEIRTMSRRCSSVFVVILKQIQCLASVFVVILKQIQRLAICDVLRYLVSFVQCKKHVSLVKFRLKPAVPATTLLKVSLLRGCFFTLCKLFKQYQIAQSVTYYLLLFTGKSLVNLKCRYICSKAAVKVLN